MVSGVARVSAWKLDGVANVIVIEFRDLLAKTDRSNMSDDKASSHDQQNNEPEAEENCAKHVDLRVHASQYDR